MADVGAQAATLLMQGLQTGAGLATTRLQNKQRVQQMEQSRQLFPGALRAQSLQNQGLDLQNQLSEQTLDFNTMTEGLRMQQLTNAVEASMLEVNIKQSEFELQQAFKNKTVQRNLLTAQVLNGEIKDPAEYSRRLAIIGNGMPTEHIIALDKAMTEQQQVHNQLIANQAALWRAQNPNTPVSIQEFNQMTELIEAATGEPLKPNNKVKLFAAMQGSNIPQTTVKTDNAEITTGGGDNLLNQIVGGFIDEDIDTPKVAGQKMLDDIKKKRADLLAMRGSLGRLNDATVAESFGVWGTLRAGLELFKGSLLGSGGTKVLSDRTLFQAFAEQLMGFIRIDVGNMSESEKNRLLNIVGKPTSLWSGSKEQLLTKWEIMLEEIDKSMQIIADQFNVTLPSDTVVPGLPEESQANAKAILDAVSAGEISPEDGILQMKQLKP
jgi:hypothetical protein